VYFLEAMRQTTFELPQAVLDELAAIKPTVVSNQTTEVRDHFAACLRAIVLATADRSLSTEHRDWISDCPDWADWNWVLNPRKLHAERLAASIFRLRLHVLQSVKDRPIPTTEEIGSAERLCALLLHLLHQLIRSSLSMVTFPVIEHEPSHPHSLLIFQKTWFEHHGARSFISRRERRLGSVQPKSQFPMAEGLRRA
jgi:hypothetical protein